MRNAIHWAGHIPSVVTYVLENSGRDYKGIINIFRQRRYNYSAMMLRFYERSHSRAPKCQSSCSRQLNTNGGPIYLESKYERDGGPTTGPGGMGSSGTLGWPPAESRGAMRRNWGIAVAKRIAHANDGHSDVQRLWVFWSLPAAQYASGGINEN